MIINGLNKWNLMCKVNINSCRFHDGGFAGDSLHSLVISCLDISLVSCPSGEFSWPLFTYVLLGGEWYSKVVFLLCSNFYFAWTSYCAYDRARCISSVICVISCHGFISTWHISVWSYAVWSHVMIDMGVLMC